MLIKKPEGSLLANCQSLISLAAKIASTSFAMRKLFQSPFECTQALGNTGFNQLEHRHKDSMSAIVCGRRHESNRIRSGSTCSYDGLCQDYC